MSSDRSVGYDFVDVHVAGSSRTRLKNVDRELTIHLAIDNLLACGS